jgi:hypothetical protein
MYYVDDGEALTFKSVHLADTEYKPTGPDLLPFINKVWIIGNSHPNNLIMQSYLYGVTADIKAEEARENQAP